MKQSYQYRIIAVITLTVSTLSAFAQQRGSTSIEIDTLTKVIGIGLTIGGFFMGYMQMRMANKIADVEARFNVSIGEVEKEFTALLEKKIEKLEGNIQSSAEKTETKIQLSVKEIESRMATRHDINNIQTIIKLNHDLDNEKMSGIKEQLKNAAAIYKRDKE